MENIPPHTMQFIPADWQDTVQLHIVAMNTAFSGAGIFTPFTAATGKHEMLDNAYAVACNAMIDFIDAHCISGKAFDEFLKTEAQNIAREKNVNIDVFEDWDDWHPESDDIVSQAEFIKHAYVHLYTRAMMEIHAQHHAPTLTL